MKRQLLTMQILRWMLLALTLALVSAQRIGPNYGITIRLTPKGLNFAGTAAATALFRPSTRLPNIAGRVGSVQYGATSIRFSGVTPPRVEVFPGFAGRNPSAKMTIDEITIDGNIWARRIFSTSRYGSFQIRASRISVETFVSLGKESRNKPEVEFDSCSSNIFSVAFTRRPSSGIRRMVSESRIRQQLQNHLQTQLCARVRGLIPQLNDNLGSLPIATRLTQSRNLYLDYSLIRKPSSHLFFIDTVVKGDWLWKWSRTRAENPERIQPYNFLYHRNKMAIYYITDYFFNALGLLLHNDGQLAYSVSREQVASNYRNRLPLSSCSVFCAGHMFPDLKARYPDGWLEVDLRTISAPTAEIGNNLVTASFPGRFVFFVKRPSGSRIQVGSGEATFRVQLRLVNSRFGGSLIRVVAERPRIEVTRTTTVQEHQAFLPLTIFQWGFVIPRLNAIGRPGFRLPTFSGVTFQNRSIEIGDGVIRVLTDLSYP